MAIRVSIPRLCETLLNIVWMIFWPSRLLSNLVYKPDPTTCIAMHLYWRFAAGQLFQSDSYQEYTKKCQSNGGIDKRRKVRNYCPQNHWVVFGTSADTPSPARKLGQVRS